MVLQEISAGKDFNTALAEGVENLKSLPGLAQTSIEHRYGFARWCLANVLNPWKSECFMIVRGGVPTFQIAYEILLQRAEGTEGYGGFKSGIIVRDRESKEVSYPEGSVYFDDQELVGAWCQPKRSDRELPRSEVMLKEFMQMKDGKPQARWATAPASQIMKCAVAEAHRRGFQPARREDVRFEAAEAQPVQEEPEALPEASPSSPPAAGLYEETEAVREEPTRIPVDQETGEILDVEPPKSEGPRNIVYNKTREPRRATPPTPKSFRGKGDFLNTVATQLGVDHRGVIEIQKVTTVEEIDFSVEAFEKIKAHVEGS